MQHFFSELWVALTHLICWELILISEMWGMFSLIGFRWVEMMIRMTQYKRRKHRWRYFLKELALCTKRLQTFLLKAISLSRSRIKLTEFNFCPQHQTFTVATIVSLQQDLMLIQPLFSSYFAHLFIDMKLNIFYFKQEGHNYPGGDVPSATCSSWNCSDGDKITTD